MTMPDTVLSRENGRSAALLTYGLYLLSIPSAGVFALIGVILAYVARSTAEGVARTHLEHQIEVWWAAFWLGVAIVIVGAVGALLSVVLIGIPILLLACLAWFIVMVWFTIASTLGLLDLLQGNPR